MSRTLIIGSRQSSDMMCRQFQKRARMHGYGYFGYDRIIAHQTHTRRPLSSNAPSASVPLRRPLLIDLTPPNRAISSTTIRSSSHVRLKSQQQRYFSEDKRNNSTGTSAIAQNDEGETEEIPLCLTPYVGLPSHPDTMELTPGQRLVAIGDVHGDFDQLVYALSIAGLVAEEDLGEEGQEQEGRSFVWIGGNAILVQIGDILDRGPHELQCWQLLAHLSRQAAAEGGTVVFLYGNHEVWTSVGFYQLDHERYMQNLDYDDDIDDDFEIEFGEYMDMTLGETEEDWRYARTLHHIVTNGIQLHPRKVACRWAALEPGGILAKHFLSNFKIAIKVGKTVLVHAGIAPEHITRHGGIKGMNDATKRWILKKGPRIGRNHMFVPPNDSEGRMRTYVQSMPDFFMEGDDNAFSPIWMRDYSDPPDKFPNSENAAGMLDEVLTKLEANRMIIGHTPQSQINAIGDGKAWRIDVGMSRDMNATTPEVLEVFKNDKGEEEVYVLTAEGKIPGEERYVLGDDHEHPKSEDGS